MKMMPDLMGEMQNGDEPKGLPVNELKKPGKDYHISSGTFDMAANSLLSEEFSKEDMMDILSSAPDDVIISAKIRRIQLIENKASQRK